MRRLVSCCACLAVLIPGSVSSQPRLPAPAGVLVYVVDSTGGTIPGAEVLALVEGTIVAEGTAGDRGGVTLRLTAAAPVRLIVTAPGFEAAEREMAPPFPAQLTITLALGHIEDEVTVSGVVEEAGSSALALSAAEIDALADDEETLRRQLEDLAGPGAEIRVDGFGGRLPPRDQILRVTIRRDAFSAEFAQPGRGRVDIITRPNAARWRANGSAQLRPTSLSAHDPIARQSTAGIDRRVRASFGGPLQRNRTALFVEGNGRRTEDSRSIQALTPNGPFLAAIKQPQDAYEISARVESLLGRSTLVRLRWAGERSTRENQGLSELDLPERGYLRRGTEQSLRASVDGGVRRPYFVRLQWTGGSNESLPDTRAPAVVVNNAFRAGGASQSGEDRVTRATIDTAFTLVSRPFNLRAGGEVSWVREVQGTVRNTLGTFTFLDNTAYAAGIPATFTQRVGAVPLTIDTMQTATFVQADKAWASGWSLGVGARYQWQTHLGDRGALSPRLGVSRAFAEGRTTLRGGAGWFYDWLPTNVWEEGLRLSRTSTEEEIIVRDPGYPNPFAAGLPQAPRQDPPSLVLIADGADMTRWSRVSLGLTQQLAGGFRLGVDVGRSWTGGAWRALDLNAPVAGVRPDPARGRTVLVDSIGRDTDTSVSVDLAYRNQARAFGSVRYSWGRRWNDGDNALTPPPEGTSLAAEWGPARNDPGHRLNWSVGGPLPYGMQVSMFGRINPGSRYTVTTGVDANRDALFNERPDGVGRNDRRGARQFSTDLRLSWRTAGPGGGGPSEQRGPGGGGRPGPGGRGGAPERSMETFVSVSNLFNRVNRTSYIGVLASPLFGQPTSASSARRIEVGWRFSL
ncbi:MAG: TonB-dependent receptor [Vicinamibacterales bacterium]|nr:TonB-dependent receptor [Vicinamibacterales bacterium]